MATVIVWHVATHEKHECCKVMSADAMMMMIMIELIYQCRWRTIWASECINSSEVNDHNLNKTAFFSIKENQF